MNKNAVLIGLVLGFLPLESYANPSSVRWRGRDFVEVRSLSGLSKPLLAALSVMVGGSAGLADRGGRFNSTDVVDTDLPMRRFILAGTDESSALVAMERGGRGYHVEVVAISEIQGEFVELDRWTLDAKPKNLPALIGEIGGAGQGVSVDRKEAERIAQEYFKLHVGCGAFSGLSESNDVWIVEGKFGFAGKAIKGFFIDKFTGRIHSTVGPSYSNEAEMSAKAPH